MITGVAESESHRFIQQLKSFGDADAIVWRNETYSYRHLLELVDEWRVYLDTHKVRAGQVVALESTFSPDACASFLALIERGVIVVPLTDLPAAKRDEFHEIAQIEAIVSMAGNEGLRCERTHRNATHELFAWLRAAEAPGLVLFSSGSSGRSKASVLDFNRVLSRYGKPTRPRRTLSFMNLDHIGGINTLFHTFSQGGAVITVDDRSPDGVSAAVDNHGVQVLPTTPTFLNMALISGAFERYTLDSLDLVTYGTEPMPQQTLQRLKGALPQVRLKQTYGLSELGILPTRSKSDDTLWVKIGGSGFEYKVVDDVLWIRSNMSMLGYLNAPSPFDDEGYFNTQDVVEQDGEYLRILGRASEIINVGGEKVYPSEVESVLLEDANVADATVSGYPSPVTGMVVRATLKLVHEEDEDTVRTRVQNHARRMLEEFKVPALIRISDHEQHSDRFKKTRRSV